VDRAPSTGGPRRRGTRGLRPAHGAPPSIDEWPVLEKEAVRDAPGTFVRGSTRLASPAATSGTTGVPLSVWRSFPSAAIEQAAIDRLLVRGNVDPQTCRAAVLRGDDIKDPSDREPPFWVAVAGGRRLVLSSNHLSAETVREFAAAIAEHLPQVLYAYPTVLESLCRLLWDCGQALQIPVTVCSSETMSASTWEAAKEVLGSRVVDYYGLAERVSFAYAHDPGRYRFLPGYSYNELIPFDANGDDDLFELVGTGLWNLKMPLVRYRTGDFVRLDPRSDPAAVAHGVQTFPKVMGRTGDSLVAPDGARLMGIDHIPRGIHNIVRMQVVQERADAVRLLVVPANGYTNSDRSAILANAAKKLPPSMTVSLEETSELVRASSGKAPFVVRRA
jgi:phenylacetate-CoA ligase